MTDMSAGAASASGGADGGAGGAATAALTSGDPGAGGGASWRDALPEPLRADPSLANFADIGALAQGYVDTKRAATARAPDFASEAGLKAFADAVRPADAKAYEIPVPDGQPTEFADAFRAFAHETGMPPAWAKATAEWWNAQNAAIRDAELKKGDVAISEFKGEVGAARYAEKLDAVKRLLPQLGVDLAPEELDRLEGSLGTKSLMRFMFNIADRLGDPSPVEGAAGAGAAPGVLTPEQAQEQWKVKQQDASWRAAAKKEGTPENKEFQRLQSLIAQGRARAKP